MTGTELAIAQPLLTHTTLGEQMDFAKAVVIRPEGAARSLLPESYRDNPANVLLAVGLGQSMGLSPAESLYRIDVIQGKPCASAELIAANVRKAGHKLRVSIDEQAGSVTATIVRADDPDYPFTLTRDMSWAQRMGLHTKDNYKKQPLTMLQWRAISGVARLACPEALYGVQYTPDEMYDLPARPSEQGGLAAALEETVTVEQVPTEQPSESPLLNTSSALARRMYALLGEIGKSGKQDRLDYCASIIGREVGSSSEMTDADAERVIAAAQALLDQPFAEPEADQ